MQAVAHRLKAAVLADAPTPAELQAKTAAKTALDAAKAVSGRFEQRT